MKNFEEKLEELTTDVKELWGRAYRDSLTQLLNRAALEDVLLKELRMLQQDSEYSFALLFMDLNGFKNINDTFGHETGDKLLIVVSEEVTKLHNRFCFRLGGDEFIVIVPSCSNANYALNQSEVLRDRLSKSYDIDGSECIVAASIGVVFCNDRTTYSVDDAIAIREVIQSGDIAMYHAKMLSKTSLLMPDISGRRQLQGRSYLFENSVPPKFKIPEFKSVLRNGIGEGRLQADGQVEECAFKIVQFSDGEILLSCAKNDESKSKIWGQLAFQTPKEISFEGVVVNSLNNSKCLVRCQHLQEIGTSFQLGSNDHEYHSLFMLSHADFNFATDMVVSMRFHLANFKFPIDRFKPQDTLQLEINGMPIRIGIFGDIENYKKLVEKLVNTDAIEVTAWIEINLKSNADVSQTVEVIDKVCRLLSFLQGSLTSWVSYDLFSKEGVVVKSQCRDSVVSRMVRGDDNGLWTASFVKAVLPRMYSHIDAIDEDWNLTKIMNFLSTAQGETRYLETRAHKIIYCIELLLNTYLERLGAPVEERNGLMDKENFSKKLMELCKSINIDCLKSDSQSHEQAISGVTREVATLRDHLHRDGSLNTDESHEDREVFGRLGFERWRRTAFLMDFVRCCIKKILDPDGNYILCSNEIGEERYDGILKEAIVVSQ